MRLQPILSYIALNCQRDGKLHYTFHLPYDNLLHNILLAFYNIEEKFVMNLKDHPALHSRFLHRPVHIDHGEFDHIGSCPLNRSVDCISLRKSTYSGIMRVDVGKITAAAENSLYIAVLFGGFNGIFDERVDRRETLEIIVYQLLGLFPSDTEPLGKAKGLNPIHNAEIGRLGYSALIGGNLGMIFSEYFSSRCLMDIHPVPESLDKVLVAA